MTPDDAMSIIMNATPKDERDTWYVDQMDNVRDLLRDPFHGFVNDDNTVSAEQLIELQNMVMNQADLHAKVDAVVFALYGQNCDYIVADDDEPFLVTTALTFTCMLVDDQREITITFDNVKASS